MGDVPSMPPPSPPPLPPPPAEACWTVCLYVSTAGVGPVVGGQTMGGGALGGPVEDMVPMLIHKNPSPEHAAAVYQDIPYEHATHIPEHVGASKTAFSDVTSNVPADLPGGIAYHNGVWANVVTQGNADVGPLSLAGGPYRHPSDLRTIAHNTHHLEGGTDGMPPSEMHHVMRDSTFNVSMHPAGTTVASPMWGTDADFNSLMAKGHHFKYAQCLKFGGAATCTEKTVGSMCRGRSSPELYGICTADHNNELICARLLKDVDEYGQVIKEYPVTDDPMACPRFAAAPKPNHGSEMTRTDHEVRMLYGGCMIVGDAAYNPHAEVHVPDMCKAPADHNKGCMFPGALNFDPTAKQTGYCQYRTLGCTDSTAFNYNPWASVDDESCILPEEGCSLVNEGYYKVDDSKPDTEDYESLFVGMPVRLEGEVGFVDYRPFLDGNTAEEGVVASRTVGGKHYSKTPEGCTTAVEGCMDATAINFDSDANINSASWCIFPTEGCMMPPAEAAARYVPGERLHTKNGVALNYAADATVHKQEVCELYSLGCTDIDAANFQIWATKDDGSCVAKKDGCLNPFASNYGCEGGAYDTAVACSNPNAGSLTYHKPVLCIFTASPPPPPPTPQTPTGQSLVEKYVSATSVTIEGEPSEICSSGRAEQMAEAAAVAQGGSLVAGSVECTSGSTNIKYNIYFDTEEDAVAAAALSPEVLEVIAEALGVPVTEILDTESEFVGLQSLPIFPPAPPPPPYTTPPPVDDGLSTGAIIGIAVGAVVGLCLCAGIAFFMMKKGKKEVSPAY